MSTQERYRRVVVMFAVLSVSAGVMAQPAEMTEDRKIAADDATLGASLGWSSSVSGDLLIVGANTSSESGASSGSAYIFGRDVGGADNWGQVRKLTAFDATAGDQFGLSVAIDGDTAIVGSFKDDDACVAVPLCESGSAYIFQRDQGGADNWGLVRKITPVQTEAGIQFGYSVAISGDTVVVGANMGFTGVPPSGAAYVFERNAGGANNWGQVRRLIASDADGGDRFGSGVGIDGDTLIVGAELGPAPAQVGSAYVFGRNVGGAGNWGEVRKLTASDGATGDKFGLSVGISGGSVIVGSGDDDDLGNRSGSAYIFERDLGGAENWGQAAKLLAFNGGGGDQFGFSTAISGDLAVAGAFMYDLNGFTSNSGAAYVYERNTGGAQAWGGIAWLHGAGDFTASDALGRSVTVDAGTVVAGANAEANFTGAAFVFGFTLGGGCNAADLAEPYGQLNFSDVLAFLTAFGSMDPAADLAAPFGTYDFSDVLAFLTLFGGGCP